MVAPSRSLSARLNSLNCPPNFCQMTVPCSMSRTHPAVRGVCSTLPEGPRRSQVSPKGQAVEVKSGLQRAFFLWKGCVDCSAGQHDADPFGADEVEVARLGRGLAPSLPRLGLSVTRCFPLGVVDKTCNDLKSKTCDLRQFALWDDPCLTGISNVCIGWVKALCRGSPLVVGSQRLVRVLQSEIASFYQVNRFRRSVRKRQTVDDSVAVRSTQKQ